MILIGVLRCRSSQRSNVVHDQFMEKCYCKCLCEMQIYDQAQVRQQGEFESLHRDIAFVFGKWEFDPTDLKNPFPGSEGSVHLWHGDEDLLIPATLQRHIAQQLPWIKYHEVSGAGHMFLFADGMGESIIRALIGQEKGTQWFVQYSDPSHFGM